jgi:hypothetical protein
MQFNLFILSNFRVSSIALSTAKVQSEKNDCLEMAFCKRWAQFLKLSPLYPLEVKNL